MDRDRKRRLRYVIPNAPAMILTSSALRGTEVQRGVPPLVSRVWSSDELA